MFRIVLSWWMCLKVQKEGIEIPFYAHKLIILVRLLPTRGWGTHYDVKKVWNLICSQFLQVSQKDKAPKSGDPSFREPAIGSCDSIDTITSFDKIKCTVVVLWWLVADVHNMSYMCFKLSWSIGARSHSAESICSRAVLCARVLIKPSPGHLKWVNNLVNRACRPTLLSA